MVAGEVIDLLDRRLCWHDSRAEWRLGQLKRIAIGAALGGLAVYFYDPELGENRRGRLSSLWRENRSGVLRAGRAASETIDSARPLAMSIGRGIWPMANRVRPAATLRRLIGAAAVGGAVVYFMDPVRGSARRLQAVGTGRNAAREIRSMVSLIVDQGANTAERIRSKVS
jgi:hypothetical protein